MTIEEKAKAYDMALAWMRELYPGLHGATKEDAEHFFPELRESEDERIRKELVALFLEVRNREGDEGYWHDLKVADILAYLEKQKEQKPIDDGTREKIISRATSEKQVVLISESSGKAEIGWDTRSLEDAKKLLEYGLAFINKNGTKPAEWSEKHIADVFEKVGLAKIVREQGNDALTNAVQSAMIELSKTKPTEWSEEDKNMWTHLNGYLNGFSCSEDAIKQMADWFYELPNRFNLQPKQEWGEEDKKMLARIIERGQSQIQMFETGLLPEHISWLKSLRPKPHWKPSKEQIDAVRYFVNKHQSEAWAATGQWKQFAALRGLLGDLLKLM